VVIFQGCLTSLISSAAVWLSPTRLGRSAHLAEMAYRAEQLQAEMPSTANGPAELLVPVSELGLGIDKTPAPKPGTRSSMPASRAARKA
jgi:hypothetical protein